MVRSLEARVAKIGMLSAPTPHGGPGLLRAEPCACEREQRIEDQLYRAACALTAQAQQAADPELRRFLTEAAGRVIATARVETRLRTLDLADPVAVTALLPEICAELWACLDGAARAGTEAGLASLAAAAIGGCDGVVDAARDVGGEMGSLSVRIEHEGCAVRRLTLVNGAAASPAARPAGEGPGARLLRALAAHFGAAPAPERGTSISLLLG